MPSPAPPLRPAATVLLLRDTAQGVQVFMERRSTQSGFVNGAYVFPGGRVDPEDAIDPAWCAGIDDADANRRLGITTGGLAHFVAAVRECFEEAGILLAYDQRGRLLDFADPALERHYQEIRRQLNAGSTTLAQVIRQERLTLATDTIGYWSHWITPLGEPKRYDTRFFAAPAPPSQTAGHDDWELTDSAWIAPAEAIARAVRREWSIIFPTLVNLRMLERHPTAESAVRWARQQPLPLPANQPRVYRGRVVLPGDDGYADGEEDISKLDRATREAAFLP